MQHPQPISSLLAKRSMATLLCAIAMGSLASGCANRATPSLAKRAGEDIFYASTPVALPAPKAAPSEVAHRLDSWRAEAEVSERTFAEHRARVCTKVRAAIDAMAIAIDSPDISRQSSPRQNNSVATEETADDTIEETAEEFRNILYDDWRTSWTAAQASLAHLQAARSAMVTILAAIDKLYTARRVEGRYDGLPEIYELRGDLADRLAAQDRAISNLADVLTETAPASDSAAPPTLDSLDSPSVPAPPATNLLATIECTTP